MAFEISIDIRLQGFQPIHETVKAAILYRPPEIVAIAPHRVVSIERIVIDFPFAFEDAELEL
jgi:hypothetical protein